MDRLLIPRDTSAASAHLHIHANTESRQGASRYSPSNGALRQWTDGDWDGLSIPLMLKIEDLGGHRVFAVDDPEPLVEVALPPGVYCVTARFGEVERQYTLHLQPSQTCDLHLILQGVCAPLNSMWD